MSRGPAVAIGLPLGAGLALLLAVRFELAWPIAAGAGVALAAIVYVIGTRRRRRRKRTLAEPFPDAWRATLEEWVGYYRDLPSDEERRRFEGEVRIFLDEQTITGPRGADVDDELKVLVAASAVVLAFGRRGYRYPRLRDIVVYERAFDDEYRVGPHGNVLGMVHGQGPILFSARSLRQGFRGEHDARNVGYHEFAHVLDFDQGQADGVPGFMPWGAVDPWVEVMHAEIDKVEHHRSLLRDYAAENEAEFFAVATEAFFEKPDQLEKKHPTLYSMMVEAYGQDPARPGEEAATATDPGTGSRPSRPR